MTPSDLKRIAGLVDAATPGPWRVRAWNDDGSEVEGVYAVNPDGSEGKRIICTDSNVYTSDADAHLIAAAPEVIAELLADVEALQEQVERFRRVVDRRLSEEM